MGWRVFGRVYQPISGVVQIGRVSKIFCDINYDNPLSMILHDNPLSMILQTSR